MPCGILVEGIADSRGVRDKRALVAKCRRGTGWLSALNLEVLS
jgi:hypothetical protein